MGVSCAEHAGGAKKDAVAATKPWRESSRAGRRVLVGAVAVLVVAAAVIFLRPSGGGKEPEAIEGTWTPLPSAGLVARTDFAYVSTGTAMIIWGGATDRPLADGAAYDVRSSTWKPVAAAPLSARRGASAVWTGTTMIVFGGQGPAEGCPQLCALNDGAAYDPATDTWVPIAPAPLAARNWHTTVWLQDRMVIWGGSWGGAAVADGASYDPASNTWTLLPAAPLEPRTSHRAVASADRMLVWGGFGATEAERAGKVPGSRAPRGKYFADGAIYNPVDNTWTPMAPYPQTTESAARSDFSSVWTGTHMLVWGGVGRTADCAPCDHDDGAAYELSSDSWKLMAPSPLAGRGNHRALWTGKEMVVLGGSGTTALNDGAAYNPATDTWSQLPVSPVLGQQGWELVRVGDNLIVWGGHRHHDEAKTRNPHDNGVILSLRW